MASIKARIYQKLQELAITPYIFPADELPQDPVYPVTIFSIVAGDDVGASNDNGNIPMRRDRMQIDVLTEDFDTAEDFIEQYHAAFSNNWYMLSDGQSPETIERVSFQFASLNPDMDYKAEPTLSEIKGRSRDYYVIYRR